MDFIMRRPMAALFGLFALLFLISSTFVIVPESKSAVILQLGKVNRVANPYKAGQLFGSTGAGIIARVPFYEQVVFVDKRMMTVQMEPQEVLSTDQLRLNVDAFASFRIVDPARMVSAVGQVDPVERVQQQLALILGPALRNELGKRPFASLLSPERGAVMQSIRIEMNRQAARYGAEIVDVRIKGADLPEGTPLQSAYARMSSARDQEALTIDAEGRKQAQIIRAEADGQAASIYAGAFNQDPDFYDFYRAMQSYRQTFLSAEGRKSGSSVILSPDSDYLRQFRGR